MNKSMKPPPPSSSSQSHCSYISITAWNALISTLLSLWGSRLSGESASASSHNSNAMQPVSSPQDATTMTEKERPVACFFFCVCEHKRKQLTFCQTACAQRGRERERGVERERGRERERWRGGERWREVERERWRERERAREERRKQSFKPSQCADNCGWYHQFSQLAPIHGAFSSLSLGLFLFLLCFSMSIKWFLIGAVAVVLCQKAYYVLSPGIGEKQGLEEGMGRCM